MTNNYQAVLEKARQAFSEQDPEEMAHKNAAAFYHYPPLSLRQIVLPYLGQFYRVLWPTGDIYRFDGQESASLPASIVILHYLCRGTGELPTGKWLSFKELWGGQSFNAAFEKRALKPLGKTFHQKEALFFETITLLGAEKSSEFKNGHFLFALPRIPVLCLLNPGDEEVPTRGNILFDSIANSYLETEDLAVLGEMLTLRLTRMAEKA